MEKMILTEPASYKELIHFSLKIYRRVFNKVLFFCLLLSLIIFLPRIIGDLTNTDVFFMESEYDPRRLWFLVIDFLAIILFIAILWDIHCFMFGLKDPLIQDIKMGFRKLGYVIIALLLQTLIIFSALFIVYGFQTLFFHPMPSVHQGIWSAVLVGLFFGVQIIFMVYVATLFIFYLPIIATENKGVFNALERSISIVWNHLWRTLTVQLTPWFYYGLVLIVLKFIIGLDIHFFFTERKNYNLQITILHCIIFTLFVPWIASLLLVQLNDLELRRKIQIKNAKK